MTNNVIWGLEPCSRARETCRQGCQVRANGAVHASLNRERDALCMVGHKRERVLGRVGRAIDAAARDFAREAAQLENGGGREAAAERLVEQQVEVLFCCFARLCRVPCPRVHFIRAGHFQGPSKLNPKSTGYKLQQKLPSHDTGHGTHVNRKEC